jgi:hypothetical protein
MAKGNPKDVYLRLVDSDQRPLTAGFNPPGLRYIPATGATLTVEFTNLDDAKVITRAASNPFSDDRSIWLVSVLATDGIEGTVSLKLTLTEGAEVRTIFVKAAIAVSSFGEVC